jgi:nucleotide-binding universal stress UspA family protein
MTANRGLKPSEHELKTSIVSTPLDGSRAALDAALGAVDRAVSRDIPLRLVYAIDSTDNSDTRRAGCSASWPHGAVCSLRVHRRRAEKPVKIKVQILQGHPTRALMDASRGAAMLCVGSIGLKYFTVAGSVRRPRPWLRGPIAPPR